MLQNVKVGLLGAGDTETLDSVMALGDKNRKTLGFMPREGFRERARSERILVATISDTVVGYAMFDLPGMRIKLIHLCVDEQHRGTQIARELVEHLSARYTERERVVVYCRRDWPATNMWPKLGFEPVGERPGRAKQTSTLTTWIRDHHTPTLFTRDIDDARLTVVLDTNVISDLHSGSDGRNVNESMALAAPWLDDQVELAVTPQVKTELNRTASKDRRLRLLAAANAYVSLKVHQGRTELLAAELTKMIPDASLKKDSTLHDDCMIVASAVVAGADVLATRDAELMKHLRTPVSRSYGLLLLPPTEIATRVDELQSAAAYSPRALHDTCWSVSELDSEAQFELGHLINVEAGERRTSFTALVRSTPPRTQGGIRLAVRRGQDPITAFLAGYCDEQTLRITMLRVHGSSPIAKTMAAQLTWMLRERAQKLGLIRVVVSDRYLSKFVNDELRRDGFAENNESLQAMTYDGCIPWAELCELVQPGMAGAQFSAHELPERADCAALELSWWPARIADAPIPSYVVPIRPAFAERLFLLQPQLFVQPDAFGLSREHVYYRAPRPQPMSAPARILWYVSRPESAVIACSTLTEVVVGEPDSLYRKYGRLGVWDEATIAKAARDGTANALVFRNTRMFTTKVPLKWLREHPAGHANWTFTGPLKIDGRLFADVYNRGVNHES